MAQLNAKEKEAAHELVKKYLVYSDLLARQYALKKNLMSYDFWVRRVCARLSSSSSLMSVFLSVARARARSPSCT